VRVMVMRLVYMIYILFIKRVCHNETCKNDWIANQQKPTPVWVSIRLNHIVPNNRRDNNHKTKKSYRNYSCNEAISIISDKQHILVILVQ
jgi:hypothetical protein